MSATFENRILSQILDTQAEKSPSSLYCIHGSNDGKSDWHHITVQEFANAVNRLAWWIDQKTNGERKQQVLAYIGTNDLRYGAFILACMKTGHVVSLIFSYTRLHLLTNPPGFIAFDAEFPTSPAASPTGHQVHHTCRWQRKDTTTICY
ncbi:NRPS-like enzyme [Penicillium malachiteum]|uniref:NRPS-like enzyme n=1 Tax=Penicillium malachiteum TaxID=1324776 RepID=A0AAD6HT78_9EURO|nr:NRPS-like enzyme [Penicillium malachiteum]